RPTGGWREGEVISDSITLTLPPETMPGTYHLFVGLYNPETGVRLPASDQGAAQANDQVHLFTVTLP
ncbi:MAG: hypothetical protein IAF02_20780, partial [Anaerolineae bacterium]|nr:hypothetical protein [Anaerolineae bacterium]